MNDTRQNKEGYDEEFKKDILENLNNFVDLGKMSETFPDESSQTEAKNNSSLINDY